MGAAIGVAFGKTNLENPMVSMLACRGRIRVEATANSACAVIHADKKNPRLAAGG
jgi:hypothetical protein